VLGLVLKFKILFNFNFLNIIEPKLYKVQIETVKLDRDLEHFTLVYCSFCRISTYSTFLRPINPSKENSYLFYLT